MLKTLLLFASLAIAAEFRDGGNVVTVTSAIPRSLAGALAPMTPPGAPQDLFIVSLGDRSDADSFEVTVRYRVRGATWARTQTILPVRTVNGTSTVSMFRLADDAEILSASVVPKNFVTTREAQ